MNKEREFLSKAITALENAAWELSCASESVKDKDYAASLKAKHREYMAVIDEYTELINKTK